MWISDTLPMPVLLGTDVTAILRGDPTTKKVVPQLALAVVTRASAARREEEEMTAQKEKESGAHSKTLEIEMQLPFEGEYQKDVQNSETISNENLSDNDHVPWLSQVETERRSPEKRNANSEQNILNNSVGIAPIGHFTL